MALIPPAQALLVILGFGFTVWHLASANQRPPLAVAVLMLATAMLVGLAR